VVDGSGVGVARMDCCMWDVVGKVVGRKVVK